jgi:flagellar assembly factor FliW
MTHPEKAEDFIPVIDEGVRLLIPHGIIGFAQLKHYLLKSIPNNDKPSLFWMLASHECPAIRFILLSYEAIQHKVNIVMDDVFAVTEQYNIQSYGNKLDLFFVVKIDKSDPDTQRITVNLRAPVVIDVGKSQAWQIILTDSKYPIDYLLS